MANIINYPTDGAQTPTVLDLTADVTLTRKMLPAFIHNTRAAGTVVVSLPQDAKAGDRVKLVVTAAQALRVTPGAAGALYCFNSTTFGKQTDNKYVGSSTVSHNIELVADGNGDWIAQPSLGFTVVES